MNPGELSLGVGAELTRSVWLAKNKKKVMNFILIWKKGSVLRDEFAGAVERMCLLELPYD